MRGRRRRLEYEVAVKRRSRPPGALRARQTLVCKRFLRRRSGRGAAVVKSFVFDARIAAFVPSPRRAPLAFASMSKTPLARHRLPDRMPLDRESWQAARADALLSPSALAQATGVDAPVGRAPARAPAPRRGDATTAARTACEDPQIGSCSRSTEARRANVSSGRQPAIIARQWARSSSSTQSDDRREAEGPAKAQAKRSKTALVLGGGGFTGGVYEIGALRALDLLAVNRTVNEFDIYVGTSAGSFVASLVANGITPEEMMRVLNKRPAVADRGHGPRHAAAPQLPRLRGAGRCCCRCGSSGRSRARRAHRRGLGDGHRRRARRGAADGDLRRHAGSRSTSQEVLSDPDRTNDFRMLEPSSTSPRPTSTRPSGSSSGEGEWADVPDLEGGRGVGRAADRLRAGRDRGPRSSSTAASARPRTSTSRSSAAPSSSSSSTRSCPTSTTSQADPDRLRHPRAPRLRHGARRRSATRPSACSPTTACTARSRTGRSYPGVDIILIEPEPDDELMFGTSIMDYSARLGSPSTASSR